jgi:hypothetical protein
MRIAPLALLALAGCATAPAPPATVVVDMPMPIPFDAGSARILPGDAGPQTRVLDDPSADIPHRLDISFEDRIHLIGYDIDPPKAGPDQTVHLTFWWRCDEPLDDGWRLLTHIDEGNNRWSNLDDVGPLRELGADARPRLGPDRWKKGGVYVDRQTYRVPYVVSSRVSVLVGIWKGDARLRIVHGASDGENRAIVGTIETGP